ncbi:hypothetical protein [Microterricola viridarii]|uniref:hypothetical protein n=1 Tax=Microterricola viridarii TaxID=412690 RepID=UPI002F9184F1
MTDQQRFDSIAALGHDHVDTPHLDRLVREGTAFTNTYVASPSAHRRGRACSRGCTRTVPVSCGMTTSGRTPGWSCWRRRVPLHQRGQDAHLPV